MIRECFHSIRSFFFAALARSGARADLPCRPPCEGCAPAGERATSATIVSAAPTAAARRDDDGLGEDGFDATARTSNRRNAWPLPLSSVLAPLVTRAGALAGERAATERAALLRALPPGEFLSCPLRGSRRFFRIYRALSSCHRAPSSPRHFRSHSRCLGCSCMIFVARHWVIRHHLRSRGEESSFIIPAACFSSVLSYSSCAVPVPLGASQIQTHKPPRRRVPVV